VSDFPDRFNLAAWLLDPNLAARPKKVAVRSVRRDLTYAQVADQAARVQTVLRELGHQQEQRVLLVCPDVPEFVAGWLGTVRAGGVFAMVNPRLTSEEYAYYLEYSRAPVAIVHADAIDAFAAAAEGARHLKAAILVGMKASEGRLPVEEVAFDEAIPAAPPAPSPVDTHRDDLCGWLFTSGTSGKPKAAMHYHADFAWNVERYAKQVVGIRESDVTMAVSKLFFGYATGTNLMFPFAVGATTALFPEASKPETVVAEARRFQPTLLAAVPTTLAGILALGEPSSTGAKEAFRSLRLVISAGEALPTKLLDEFTERFGVEILDGIGSAEMFHIYISNRPGDVTPGSLGRLVPGYAARVVGADGIEVVDGEVGTLQVSGESAALGYFQDAAKSRATFKGDTCVSGDLFRKDRDGRFWYEGRADDMLKVGGIWVAPREVEECLLTHAAVRDCCVVGFEDERGLVTPLAYVVVREGVGGARVAAGPELTAKLVEHVKSKLSHYKAPRRIEYLPALPRNDRGKIARAELRKLANSSSGAAPRAAGTGAAGRERPAP
jgi:benzoate-CoA ligase family protein